VDGALALRDALAKEGIEAFVLDPSTAGGCGGEADHRPAGASLRSAPPARVVRCAVEARRLDAVRSAVEAAGSRGKVLERSLGGSLEGEVWVDAILLGE
jgi:hypothetical protein